MGFITQIIFEKIKEAEAGLLQDRNPTVISCGGIYIPRKKIPDKIVFQVLNLANDQEPIKIYTGRHGRLHLLQDILAKEHLN